MKLTGTNYSIVLILKMLMSGERFVEQSNTSINQNVSSFLGSVALTGWLLQGDRTRSHPEHDR
jgi:hypothetical protein